MSQPGGAAQHPRKVLRLGLAQADERAEEHGDRSGSTEDDRDDTPERRARLAAARERIEVLAAGEALLAARTRVAGNAVHAALGGATACTRAVATGADATEARRVGDATGAQLDVRGAERKSPMVERERERLHRRRPSALGTRGANLAVVLRRGLAPVVAVEARLANGATRRHVDAAQTIETAAALVLARALSEVAPRARQALRRRGLRLLVAGRAWDALLEP